MSDAAFNLSQLERRPNWYEHLGAIENAMAAEDQLYRTRWHRVCDHWVGAQQKCFTLTPSTKPATAIHVSTA